MKQHKIMNTIHTLAIATGLFGCVALGNAQAQTYRDRDNDGLIEISYIEQLDSIRYNLTGTCSGSTCNGYELTRNLDFNDNASYRNRADTASRGFYTASNGYWRPVGTSTLFNTTLEGNNYSISNVRMHHPSEYIVGFFTNVGRNALLKNIHLRNVTVQASSTARSISLGSSSAGALAGVNEGTIMQSSASGSVLGSTNVGGLVGLHSGTISQSHSTVSVTGSYRLGGLVGYNNLGIISQSSASGSVRGSDNVGGLVGLNDNGTISQCHATVSVTGNNYYVGGLAGQNNNGTISQSYATGYVSGTNHVGGLAGHNNNGTISQSYATGYVSGTSDVGGLVGYNYNNGTILHGSWNLDAAQTVSGTARINNAKVGIGTNIGTAAYIRGLTLSALRSPTGTVSDSIRELGPGFLYYRGQLPKLHTGARVTVNGIHFTELLPTLTNIGTSSAIAIVMQGTATTRATLSVGGVNFTANVIDTTSGRLRTPYTITNIQNGVKQPQTVTFASLSIQTFGQAPFVLSASSSEGLPVLFSASNNLISINTNTVTIRGVGTTQIAAYILENDTVAFASQTQILSIQKGNQSISFASFTSKTFGNAPFVLLATSSAGLSLVYSASNTLISINNTTVTIRGAGTVDITAYSIENDTVAFASQTQILSIQKGTQSISFASFTSKTFGNAPFVLMASTSAGLSVLFSASDTLVSINNNTVTIRGAGTVRITATQTGNENYESANAVSQILSIQKGNQSISFASFTSKTFGNAPFVLSATSSAGLSLVYSVSNTLISINSNTVTINGAGTVNITASNTGNTNYLGAFATQIFTITEANNPNKTNPTLTFTAIPNLTVGQKYVMTATSNSPVTIIFTSSDTNKVSIRGNTATAKAIGNVVITASQEANASFNPATAQQTVTVVAITTPTMYPLTFIEKANSAIRIYPNPANDYITIQYDKTQKVASVKIYDMTGKSYELGIRNYELGLRIDLKTLPKGEYIIILYGEKGEVWKAEKVIKE